MKHLILAFNLPHRQPTSRDWTRDRRAAVAARFEAFAADHAACSRRQLRAVFGLRRSPRLTADLLTLAAVAGWGGRRLSQVARVARTRRWSRAVN
jgi:hypothetical protein